MLGKRIDKHGGLLQLGPFSRLEVIHMIDQPGPISSQQLSHFGYCTALRELRIVFAGDGTTEVCWRNLHCPYVIRLSLCVGCVYVCEVRVPTRYPHWCMHLFSAETLYVCNSKPEDC